MDWLLPLPAIPGGPHGWSVPDLPLSDELPPELVFDLSAVTGLPHPVFAVRLRAFVDWHARRRRAVRFAGCASVGAAAFVSAGFRDVASDAPGDAEGHPDMVIPVRTFAEEPEIDAAAGDVQHALEYDRPELAEFGDAVFQAVSELCSNGLQHGGEALGLGVFLAARVRRDPRRQLDIAIGDWGVGIPEHIRNAYPEWLDDDFAIAQALQPGVSGTGDGHRGYGFHHTFEAALTSALHASRIEVHSGGGFVRREVVQETVSYQTFPPPRRRRGTRLCLSLTSVS